MNFEEIRKREILVFLLLSVIFTYIVYTPYASGDPVSTAVQGKQSVSLNITINNVEKFVANYTTEDLEKPVTREEKSDFYKDVLNISKNVSVSTSSAEALIYRGVRDVSSFNNIVKTARIIKKEDSRERVAVTLLNMDRNFVNRFSAVALTGKVMERGAEQQIDNYFLSLSQKSSIRRTIPENYIKSLFDKEITREEFIIKVLEK